MFYLSITKFDENKILVKLKTTFVCLFSGTKSYLSYEKTTSFKKQSSLRLDQNPCFASTGLRSGHSSYVQS